MFFTPQDGNLGCPAGIPKAVTRLMRQELSDAASPHSNALARSRRPLCRNRIPTRASETASENKKSGLLRGRFFCIFLVNLLIHKEIILVAWGGIERPVTGRANP